jgi:hypothetical protein
MQPDCKPGQPAGEFDCARRGWRSYHQARSREDSFDVRDLDRPVHFVGKAEIVRGDDEIFQCRLQIVAQPKPLILFASRRLGSESVVPRCGHSLRDIMRVLRAYRRAEAAMYFPRKTSAGRAYLQIVECRREAPRRHG